jgi:alpha-ketoglutarate-dependent sulfate ester dioxygenase
MTSVETVPTKDPGAHLSVAGMRTKSGRHYGPMPHVSAERSRLNDLIWNNFHVERLGATVGAVLHGVDLCGPLSDDVIAEIRQALIEYKVIFFRNQPLTGAQHVAVARRFGELEIHPFIPANTGQPELVRFEKSAEVGGYENQWHHDVTWRECPSMGAILHAVHVPEVGGDTLFCDMYAAYEGLPDETRERIDGLTATHDFMNSFGRGIPPEKLDEMRARYPQQTHPVVARHVESGRRHLYVNRTFVEHINGMDREESAALLNELYAQADRPEYQCRFRWERDSVAFWDNRAVQHYAASDYWPDIRIMERASIIGCRPL